VFAEKYAGRIPHNRFVCLTMTGCSHSIRKEWLTPCSSLSCDRSIEKDGQIVPIASAAFLLVTWSSASTRSASDDKAPIISMATALDAIHAAGLKLHSNIKFVFEAKRRPVRSISKRSFAAHRDLFPADLWLIWHTRRPDLPATGSRSARRHQVDITIYGARRELHSGHYGTGAEPAMMLAWLLTSMKDDSGHVLIDGFLYDGIAPLSDTEKRAIAEAPISTAN
jgi:hypothetical protein